MMNDELKQELCSWGVDWPDVSARFMGNDDLVIKFMLKFADDHSMEELTAALAGEDAENAFKAIHTLKGVTGNLGMNAIHEDVYALTEILRAGSLNGAKEKYDRIKIKYDELIKILKKYQ
ncbi:MAG: Hpt domain-containing protein [Butyrivibrio sp.]|nr:Hpt domain-containing protein [Butyrivibrio sp.]